jgi:hypothetical protein
VRDQLHAQNVLGELFRLVDVLRDLDAAALAAPAGVDLRLDDDGPRRRAALAALSASSKEVAISPLGTATPYLRRISLA